eukprot:1271905-Lingulodinium_polyedra.AAC.1
MPFQAGLRRAARPSASGSVSEAWPPLTAPSTPSAIAPRGADAPSAVCDCGPSGSTFATE